MNSEKSFGQRIREMRTSAGLTQGQLGQTIGVTKQAIQNIESGRRETTLPKIILLADYFNVDANYLLGRVEVPDSFSIKELEYDGDSLFIRFRDGDWYKYFHVPEEVYKKFLESKSKGKFFRENIMTKYSTLHTDEPSRPSTS